MTLAGAEGAPRPGTAGPGRRDLRGASRRFDEALAAARREGRSAASEPGGPPAAAGVAPGERRAAAVELGEAPLREAASASAGAAAPLRGGEARPDDGAAPEVVALRAGVRALPAVIEAARLHDGAELTLAMGSALGVDLRGGADGVELTLRPEAPLARAAAAELPALVDALRARGVRVVRAGVQVGSGVRRPAGPPARQPR